MHHTVELLVNGDRKINDYYRAAVEHWKGIWSRPESKDVAGLAEVLSTEQSWFEQHCGASLVGQEVMVVSGFAMLYTTQAGFNGNATLAQKLYDAFQMSYCSIEVKSLAREVAESYGLLEERVA